jgi:hypothetical protein
MNYHFNIDEISEFVDEKIDEMGLKKLDKDYYERGNGWFAFYFDDAVNTDELKALANTIQNEYPKVYIDYQFDYPMIEVSYNACDEYI